MNENLDLTKILDGCPEGTEFYSPMMGNVKFDSIAGKFVYVTTKYGNLEAFNKNGFYGHYDGECMLLPSRTQRDWSKFVRFWNKNQVEDSEVEKFDPKIFQPFDKVLVRDRSDAVWQNELFGYINESCECICTYSWKQCIPYNGQTKHLIGTKEDCLEYYKWWEE